MQQSGFHQMTCGWEIMVWMISNHLAVGLHLDSGLSKGSVWDVDVPEPFNWAIGDQRAYLLLSACHFFHVFYVECLF